MRFKKSKKKKFKTLQEASNAKQRQKKIASSAVGWTRKMLLGFKPQDHQEQFTYFYLVKPVFRLSVKFFNLAIKITISFMQ